MFASFLVISAKGQNCKIDKNGYKDVPCAHIKSTISKGKYKQLKGKVNDNNGESILSAIVSLHQITENEAKFIGSQEVDYKGRFCFKNLPKGKYVLKVGAKNFNCFDVELEIDKKDKNALNEELIIELPIGT